MKKITVLTIFLLLLPLCLVAESPYFTVCGQLSIPAGDFGGPSQKYDAHVDLGYGGGIDLNVHFNKNFLWMTSLTFSAHDLRGQLRINDRPLLMQNTYSIYNLPVVSGILYRITLESLDLGFSAQAGLNYAEFPSVSGTLVRENILTEEIDTIIEGQTKFGYSLGAKVGYRKFVIGLRYMMFGDYHFSGAYKSSKTEIENPLVINMAISYFMINLGYNFDLLGDR